MTRRLAVLLLAIVALLPVATATAQAPPVARGNGQSREAPLALGEIGQVGDYSLKLLSVTPDATSEVMLENQFNDPPVPGNVFFMIRVEVTYTGVETGTPGFDLDFNVVGSNNRGYADHEFSCGVIPDSGYDTPELFTGGAAEFNVCWSVPAEEVDSLVMYIESGFSDARTWFSLKETTVSETSVPRAPVAKNPRVPATSPPPAPTTTTVVGPPVQGPITVGQTQVTWTGAWQYDGSSSMEQQVTLTQVDPVNGTIKLATYGEFHDASVSSAEMAIDTFAQAFFQGAGATSIVWAGKGMLPNGTIWKLYTFDLQGLQLTFLATISPSASGAWIVSTLTSNTDQFPATIEQAQQEILLNGGPVFLEGINAVDVIPAPVT